MALGYTMVYGIINLINFAHGEVLMVGALTSWAIITTAQEAMPGIPGWLLPRDREALQGLFRGESPVPWDAWAPALAAWGSLVLAVAFAGLALRGSARPPQRHRRNRLRPPARHRSPNLCCLNFRQLYT